MSITTQMQAVIPLQQMIFEKGGLTLTTYVLCFFHAAIAALGILSALYVITKDILYKHSFILLFISVSIISYCTLSWNMEAVPFGAERELIMTALVLLSFSVFSLFQETKKKERRHFSGYRLTLILTGVVIYLLIPASSMAAYVLPVYYIPLIITIPGILFSQKNKKRANAPYKKTLLVICFFFPAVFLKNFPLPHGLLHFVPVAFSGIILLYIFFSLFNLNNISKKQLPKYFLSLLPIYFICLYFSYFYSSYLAFVMKKQHFQKEIFLVWTHLCFMAIVLAYLFYGYFSKWLVKFFMKGYESKDKKLRELSLHINPLYRSWEILCAFAEQFEHLMGFKVKAAVYLQDERKIRVFARKEEKEVEGSIRSLKDMIMERIILPSEFFFRSTFHLLRKLKKTKVAEDFGYIIPIHIRGEFDGFFVTEAHPLKEKLLMSRILPFFTYFKATVERVMVNALQLGHEKKIQDKILALQEKKRTSEEFKKKNAELQKALEEVKNKQKQLITAEKWASICQVTVSLNHEINNPLTHIMGSSQILRMQLKKGVPLKKEELYQYLSKVEEQCQRIKEIIENLRKISEPVAISYISDTKMLKLRK